MSFMKLEMREPIKDLPGIPKSRWTQLGTLLLDFNGCASPVKRQLYQTQHIFRQLVLKIYLNELYLAIYLDIKLHMQNQNQF